MKAVTTWWISASLSRDQTRRLNPELRHPGDLNFHHSTPSACLTVDDPSPPSAPGTTLDQQQVALRVNTNISKTEL